MKQSERAGIARVFSDLIYADGIIDTREVGQLDSLRRKYGIRKEDEEASTSLTLAQAIRGLACLEAKERQGLLDDFMSIAMSDDFCAREEALLIMALRDCLGAGADGSETVISVKVSSLDIEESQILYVESGADEAIARQIADHYREIRAEIRLAGFDFVYLPKVAEHYRALPADILLKVMEFLYPKVGGERLQAIASQLQNLSTHMFCREQIAMKLGVREMLAVEPSLMVRVGDSIVDNERVANFLLIGVGSDILGRARGFADAFAGLYNNSRLCYLREADGRFVFKGFHKQILDILTLRQGIRSRVVVDTLRERIYLPEADACIEKIHRREKVLYALMLIESARGGVNFNRAKAGESDDLHTRRMDTIQAKYRALYALMGGDEEGAPNITVPEIRLPMMSLLRRQIMKLSGLVSNAEDYTISRNAAGNYSVSLAPELCCCECAGGRGIEPLAGSELARRVAATPPRTPEAAVCLHLPDE